ncbi:MAG TPA: hypothetical protein VM581_01995, partial [Magnetospirillaceae bacterium]|nr:hypothetical protein [Magnetospirillaceae bacterium]
VNEKWGGASQGSSPRGGGPAPHRVFSSARKLAAENSRYVSPHLVWLRQLLIVASLIIISFSGLLLFSLYLWQHTGDPIAYSHIQEFWPGRGGLSNITAELAYLWAHKTINLEYALTLMWYGATLVAFGGVALLIRMREYLMALYSGIAVSLPLVFGTATAMNRYMLVAVPIFIAYAVTLEQQRRWVKGIIVVACLAGLAGAIFLIVDPRAAFVG